MTSMISIGLGLGFIFTSILVRTPVIAIIIHCGSYITALVIMIVSNITLIRLLLSLSL